MIIMIQGTKEKSNRSEQLAAALSFFGIRKEKKRTLVLQFVDQTNDNIENCLIGRSLRNESLIQDELLPDISVGMDALCIHSGSFSAPIFDECTRHLATGSTNHLYDLAIVTRKDSFEQEIMTRQKRSVPFERNLSQKNALEYAKESYIGSMLKSAGEIYDIVLCLLPSQNPELCEALLPFADVNLICIRQGRAESVNRSGKTDLFVVTDYCTGSIFHAKALAKTYQVKTVYGLMHDIGFSDACAEGTLLDFLQKNIFCEPNEIHYPLIHNLDLIYQAISSRGKEKEELEPSKKGYCLPNEQQKTSIKEDILEEITETGRFKKKHTKKLIIQDNSIQAEKEQVQSHENAKKIEKKPKKSLFWKKKSISETTDTITETSESADVEHKLSNEDCKDHSEETVQEETIYNVKEE